jgi:hypothetical protein
MSVTRAWFGFLRRLGLERRVDELDLVVRGAILTEVASAKSAYFQLLLEG